MKRGNLKWKLLAVLAALIAFLTDRQCKEVLQPGGAGGKKFHRGYSADQF